METIIRLHLIVLFLILSCPVCADLMNAFLKHLKQALQVGVAVP